MRNGDIYHFPIWIFLVLNLMFFFIFWKTGGIKIERKVEDCSKPREVMMMEAVRKACTDSRNYGIKTYTVDKDGNPSFTCKNQKE